MATQLTFTCMQQGYATIVQDVLNRGREASPRGLKTRELRDVVITFTNPRNSLPVGTGRKLNAALGVAEALQLISGRSEPELLCRITPNFRQFMHDTPSGLVQHGAYGPRAHWQTAKIIQRLKADPDTRQAVVSVYNPALDLTFPAPKDVPCTLNLNFWQRDDFLYLTVMMRSNDVWWGLAYDAFQFSMLQCSVAKALDLNLGQYTHIVNSLHIYERDYDAAWELHRTKPGDAVSLKGVGHRGMPWEEITHRASTLLDGRLPVSPTPSERWMWEHIHPYTVKDC